MLNPFNEPILVTPPDETVKNGIVAYLPGSDIRVRKDGSLDIEFDGNVITKINLKRAGTYRGKKYDRKFRKIV